MQHDIYRQIFVLSGATPDEIEKHVRKRLEIFSTPENIKRMYETVHKYGSNKK